MFARGAMGPRKEYSVDDKMFLSSILIEIKKAPAGFFLMGIFRDGDEEQNARCAALRRNKREYPRWLAEKAPAKAEEVLRCKREHDARMMIRRQQMLDLNPGGTGGLPRPFPTLPALPSGHPHAPPPAPKVPATEEKQAAASMTGQAHSTAGNSSQSKVDGAREMGDMNLAATGLLAMLNAPPPPKSVPRQQSAVTKEAKLRAKQEKEAQREAEKAAKAEALAAQNEALAAAGKRKRSAPSKFDDDIL